MKTFKEYKRLGCPEEYLKKGDKIDIELAHYLTDENEDLDSAGVRRSSHMSAMCGSLALRHTIERGYGEPWTYCGECRLGSTRNRNPWHSKKVFVCSPYRSNDIVKKFRNIELARKACMIIIGSGNFPVAPHLYFPVFLDDDNEDDRNIGIEYGIFLLDHCDEILVIYDKEDLASTRPTKNAKNAIYRTLTDGMREEVDHAVQNDMDPRYIEKTELWKIITE